MTSPLTDRLAVCSWSLQAKNIEELVDRLKQTGATRIQLELDHIVTDPDNWAGGAAGTLQHLKDAGITVISGMFGGIDEDYSSLETIKVTGGVAPDETWPKLWAKVPGLVEAAKTLSLDLVTFHAGFLPHDTSDPVYAKLKDRIVQIADAFAAAGIKLGFETGQETADTLKAFLDELGQTSVGVNFDPANMILYDKGDPVEAVRTLAPYLVQCHIKDATYTKEPGTWGAEVAAGTGDVNWDAFFKALDEVGFNGNLAIEREAGDQRIVDIAAAREMVEGFSK